VKAGAPPVWADQPGNLAFETSVGDAAATQQAFAQAARTVSLTIVNQRLVTNYMDTRGVIAEYDGDRYTLTLGSQGSHIIRDIIGGDVMKLPPEKMRVITPDVGGGFGTKLFPYREYALAAVAAQRTGKPVKWVADRSEHFLGDSHGRDNISTAKLAIDDKGKCRTRRRPAKSMTPAISPAAWRARRKSPTGRVSTNALPLPNAPGSCAASAWRPMSRPAAITGRRPRPSIST
jgi:CO/xanthine dehydrogenase Mo-binding subunit